jgi:polyisoprenoid-binding protein YceI
LETAGERIRKMKAHGSRLLSLLVALVLATAAHAQQKAPAPGSLHLDSSRVYIFVAKTGLGHDHAVIGRLSAGEIHLGAPRDAGHLVFDMATFAADTPEARKALRLEGESKEATRKKVTENMHSAEVLDVERFPQAEFQIDSAAQVASAKGDAEGSARFVLKGNFTLHGVEQAIEVPVIVENQRGWLRVRGNFAINQSDYGIKPLSKGFGAIGVADGLRIYGDLWVRPE